MDSHRIEFFGLPGCGKTFLVEKITSIDRKTLSQKATNKISTNDKKLLSFLRPLSIISFVYVRY